MAIVNLSGTWSAFKNATVGPWKIGTTWYRLGIVATSATIDRSSDGLTWGNGVAAAGTDVVSAVGAVDGTTIYVAIVSKSNGITLRTYDTTTNTWGSTTSTVPTSAATSATGAVHVTITPRGNGQAVVAFTSAVRVISMVNYRRFSIGYGTIGGAFTTVVLPEPDAVNYDIYALVQGSSNRIHVFYTGLVGTTRTLYHKTFLSTDAWSGTRATIATVGNVPYPVGIATSDGTEIAVPYVTTGARLSVATATSADAPTFSTTEVSGTAKYGAITSSSPAALDYGATAGNLHAVWPVESGVGIFHAERTSGTWGTPTVIEVGAQSYTAAGSIGVVISGGAGAASSGIAQSFVPTASMNLSSVSFAASKLSAPTDNLVVSIRSSLTGSDLASTTLAGTGLSTSVQPLIAYFPSPVALTASQTYYIVLTRSGATDTTNRYSIRALSGGDYANGAVSSFDGTTWTAQTYDMAFALNAPVAPSSLNFTHDSNKDYIIFEDRGLVGMYTDDTGVTEVLVPVADTMVQQDNPSTNYGTATVLSVDNLTPKANAWFKFTIPSGGAVRSARLELWLTNGQSGAPGTFTITATTATWDETTLTWNNAPSVVGSSVTVPTPGSTVGWSWDNTVNGLIPDSGDITLVMVGSTDDGIDMDSREGAHPPRLILSREVASALTTLSLSDTGTLGVTDTADIVTSTQTTASLSDTGTIAGTDAYAAARTQTNSDSGTVGSTDTYSALRTLDTNDSGTISRTEALTQAAFPSLTDTPTLGATESIATTTFVAVSYNDAGTLASTDALAGSTTITSTDSGTVTSVDTYAAQESFATTDSGTVTSSESAALAAFPTLADTQTLGATESISTTSFVAVTYSDAATLASTDTLAGSTTITSSDSGTIASTDAYAAVRGYTANDSVVVTSVDTYSAARTQTNTDSVTLVSADTSGIASSVAPTDTVALGVSEAVTTASTVTTTDSGTITSTEAVAGASTTTSTDAGTVAATESFVQLVSSTLTLSDSGTLTSTETRSLSANLTASDTGTIATSEAMLKAISFAVGESSTLTGIEGLATASSLSQGDTGLLASTEDYAQTVDSGASYGEGYTLASIESFTIASNVTSTDTASVVSNESVVSSAQQTQADASLMTAAQSFTSQVAVSYTENVSVAAGEAFDVLTSADTSLSDTFVLGASETLAGASTTTGSDSGALAASESQTILTDQTMTYTDASTMSATQGAVIDASVARTDTTAIGSTDSFTLTQSTVAYTDTDTMAASESFTIVLTSSATTLTDEGTFASAETFNVLGDNQIDLADAGSLNEATAYRVVTTSTRTDSVTMGTSESFATQAVVSRTDSVTLGGTETRQTSGSLPLLDADTLSILEAFDVEQGTQPMFDDTLFFISSESVAVQTQLGINDTNALQETTTADLVGNQDHADDGTLTVSEAWSLFVEGLYEDTAAVAAAEAFSVQLQVEGEWYDSAPFDVVEFFEVITQDVVLPEPDTDIEPIKLISRPNMPFLRQSTQVGLRFAMRYDAFLRLGPTKDIKHSVDNLPFLKKQGRVDVR